MIRLVAVIGGVFLFSHSFAQVVDSSHTGIRPDTTHLPVPTDSSLRKPNRLKNNNILKFFMGAVSHGGHYDSSNDIVIRGRHVDSAALATALNTKSETPFKPYQGRIIRHILIKGYGFEQSFTDTSKRLQYFGTKVLNQLHRKTRDWVIRNSMFIKEGTALNAFKLADNERLIRSLNFIQDARILVDSLGDNSDSVDLVVVVKDLFSIGGAIGSLNVNPQSFRGNVSEANFLGMGQRIQGGGIPGKTQESQFRLPVVIQQVQYQQYIR